MLAKGVWHEPQVRYLLADMTFGGKVQLYRDYATTEHDPDSREAIRLWDTGARVVNTNEFERKWITNQFGKDGRVMRIVQRGSDRTIIGTEVLLTSDLGIHQSRMRNVLTDLTLGRPLLVYEKDADASVKEAVRRWKDGVRAVISACFANAVTDRNPHVVYRGSSTAIDGSRVQLNSDTPHMEANARYFLADMFLGGGRDFYYRASESAHEMGCREAVARFDHGVKIINLSSFERKQVDGKTLITRKGSNDRINGMDVKLSTDHIE